MTGKVGITIAPTSSNIAAGDTTQVMVTLRNLGQTVDQFTITIDGLDPSWYTLPVSSVALFPGDQDNLRIVLHPPKTGIKAGVYPFRAKVTSRESPAEATIVELTLQIWTPVALDISPPTVTGRKGVYRILVTNLGDSETTIELKANDPRGKLRFNLQPNKVKMAGGERVEFVLKAGLGWLALFGGKKEIDFKVQALFPGGEEAKSITGQLIYLPWYRFLTRIRLPWLMRPPLISSFTATTQDKREFRLIWSVKRATKVELDGVDVEPRGERLVRPAEAKNYVLTAINKYGKSTQTVAVEPLPMLKVSERIMVSLSPTELKVNAGGVPMAATLQLQNVGGIVDKFLVEVKGLDEGWYSCSASSVALMPQAAEQMQISFHPPKRKGVKAGTYPFTIMVCSQSIIGEATTIAGQLKILPLLEFELGVRPYRASARRKGIFRINLANTGVSDAAFTLAATDRDEGLRFKFKTDSPVVSAWDSLEVPLIARPKRGWIIGEMKRYDITIMAKAREAKAQSVNCELNHIPLMSSWQPILRFVRTIITLGIIVAIGYFMLQWGGGWQALKSNPQTWVENLIEKLIRTIERWFVK